MEKLAVWIVALACAIGSFFFGLWSYTKIWALIAVPMGAHSLTMTQAYGIAMLVGFFVAPALARYVEDKEGDASTRILRVSATTVISHLITWGMAIWIFG